MEIWDAYYKDETLAGKDLLRGEPIPDGLLHLVCDIIVRHTDGSHLLMQRDFRKESFPGLYELTAGGSANKGETPLQCALRELKEETGINAETLTRIYRIVSPEKHTIYHGFLCVTDCVKDSVALQELETISYLWLPEKELFEFVKTDKFIQPYKDRTDIYLNALRNSDAIKGS